jgi:pilus assembly protein CpaC
MIKVKIAEISRSVTEQLGINWQTIGQDGSTGMMIGTTASIPDAAKFAGESIGNVIGSGSPGSYMFQGNNMDAILSALDQDSLAHLLAEPTLTALSGYQASFISGGSFPVPTPGANGQVSVAFQNYGVQLHFTPNVLSNGEIFMHVAPTVSTVSNLDSVSVPTGGSAIVVPSLLQQSADTTVIVGSGQTFAIAGLLQESSTQSDQTVPGLGALPVIGGAFRADDESRSQEELVVLVTPYIVQPQSDPNAYELAGDGWSPPNLVQRLFFGEQNGSAETAKVSLPSNVGLELQ